MTGRFKHDPIPDMVAAAKAVLAGDVDVLTGAQRMTYHLVESDLHSSPEYPRLDEVCMASAGLPFGPDRQYWNAAALKRKDEEIARLIEQYREDVLASCLRLVAQFG